MSGPSSMSPPRPRLFCPLPGAIHPDHRQVEEGTRRWARAAGLDGLPGHEALLGHRMGELAARVLPGARREAVQLLGDLAMWLFHVDDDCEDGPLGVRPAGLADRLSRLLYAAEHPGATLLPRDPVADAVRDLRRRTEALFGPHAGAAWLDSLRAYFLSLLWEAGQRTAPEYPGIESYALMRLHSGAVDTLLPFLEHAHGLALPPAARHDPRLTALEEMAAFLIGWSNDLLSYRKESTRPGRRLDVVTLLRRGGASLADAVTVAVGQYDRVMGRFLELGERVAATAPGSRRYVAALHRFVRGAGEWELTSPRYGYRLGPHLLARAFADHPSPAAARPLGIPALQWWWDAETR
ncbi:terpene synthase family protein [Streptomyces erythrochromogenes]|uniref:terpene synthase family protein n=1 Tax=Streptomyces erythrochromogenes TaxID=285574 RepID=UPI0036CA337A